MRREPTQKPFIWRSRNAFKCNTGLQSSIFYIKSGSSLFLCRLPFLVKLLANEQLGKIMELGISPKMLRKGGSGIQGFVWTIQQWSFL